jgi:hypothetical protein
MGSGKAQAIIWLLLTGYGYWLLTTGTDRGENIMAKTSIMLVVTILSFIGTAPGSRG